MGRAAGRIIAVAAAMVAAVAQCASRAADLPLHPDWLRSWTDRDRAFFFAGMDLSRDSGFAWAGVGGAPSGLLHEDGLRLRLAGGGGRYRYRTNTVPTGVNEVDVASLELMLGYRRAIGSAVVTTYIGAHAESQDLQFADPGHRVAGTAVGVKLALDYFDRPPEGWLILGSAAASTVHRSYYMRLGVGRQWRPDLALGIEAALLGNTRHIEPRAGIFAQQTFGRTSLAISGGYLRNSGRGGGPYGMLSVYAPY
jgi:hypothetical protein